MSTISGHGIFVYLVQDLLGCDSLTIHVVLMYINVDLYDRPFLAVPRNLSVSRLYCF